MREADLSAARARPRAARAANEALLDPLRNGASIERATFDGAFVALACALDGTLEPPARCP